MTVAAPQPNRNIPEDQRGPAERVLSLLLSTEAHLWRGRPGLNANGKWVPRPKGVAHTAANAVKPGLFVPEAVALYRQLVEIYRINAELSARFASYAMLETEWRDLKVACAALMLVQGRSGQPVKGADGAVEFFDDDYRAVGQGMILRFERKSKRTMEPKNVLRIAQFLETPEIAAINREAGFGKATSTDAPMGRWRKAATAWLRVREENVAILQGLVAAGRKHLVRRIAKKAHYKPTSQAFFEILGWEQVQDGKGHRTVGLADLKLSKQERFDGMTEGDICARIAAETLSYKTVVGRLPKDPGLTPAIMVACLPSLSDRDLRMLTPTLEELDLLKDPAIRARWERAISTSTDQRALNVAKNVKGKELRERLETAADVAVQKAVAAATEEADVHVMFLVDVSGSMAGAIEESKEALSRILAGFPPDKVHVASFNTMGTVLRPRAPTRAGVQHMLANVRAEGGTVHGCAVRALHGAGVRIPEKAHLIVIVAGDEDGEDGPTLAQAFETCGYRPAAIGHIVALSNGPVTVMGTHGRAALVNTRRGFTVRHAATIMKVPYAEVDVDQFADAYSVPRVLQSLLEAPLLAGGPATPRVARASLVEKIMRTPLLLADGTVEKVAVAP